MEDLSALAVGHFASTLGLMPHLSEIRHFLKLLVLNSFVVKLLVSKSNALKSICLSHLSKSYVSSSHLS